MGVKGGERCTEGHRRDRMAAEEVDIGDDRPTLEMLVTLPSGGAASLAASAACPLLI
jgi:hypothetical protein